MEVLLGTIYFVCRPSWHSGGGAGSEVEGQPGIHEALAVRKAEENSKGKMPLAAWGIFEEQEALLKECQVLG